MGRRSTRPDSAREGAACNSSGEQGIRAAAGPLVVALAGCTVLDLSVRSAA